MKHKKVIFITGTSRGLGKAIFDKLTSDGHIVYGASRNPLPEVKNQFKLDVTDYNKCTEVINTIIEKEGRIHVLINNVGGHLIGAAMEVTNEELQSQVDMNFYSAVHTIKAVMDLFRCWLTGFLLAVHTLTRTTYRGSAKVGAGAESWRRQRQPRSCSVDFRE